MARYDEIRTTEFTLKESGLIEARITTRVFKDGVAFGEPAHHRSILTPDTDLNDVPLSPTERGPIPKEAKAAISAWRTPQRVAKYQAAKAAIEAAENARVEARAASAPAAVNPLIAAPPKSAPATPSNPVLNTLTLGLFGN